MLLKTGIPVLQGGEDVKRGTWINQCAYRLISLYGYGYLDADLAFPRGTGGFGSTGA